MPLYWVTAHYTVSYNRLDLIEAVNEQEAIDLTQDEDHLNTDMYEPSSPQFEDIDVNLDE